MRPPGLLELLATEPYALGFYPTMGRLEAMFHDRPRLGRAAHPSHEPVRLGQEPSLVFAPSTLSRWEPEAEGRAPRLFSTCSGCSAQTDRCRCTWRNTGAAGGARPGT